MDMTVSGPCPFNFPSQLYIQNTTLLVFVPTDALAHSSARPSASTVLTTKLDIFSSKFLWLSTILFYFLDLNGPKWLQRICMKSSGIWVLTHWDRDKMVAIFQTTFSNAFSWMKMYEFRLRFHWILFPWVLSVLVQIMAWRRPGDKPWFEPMMVSLLTHICVTRPQWVNGAAGWEQKV